MWIFVKETDYRSSPSEVFIRKGVLKNTQQIYRITPMPECDLNKIALLKSHVGMVALF